MTGAPSPPVATIRWAPEQQKRASWKNRIVCQPAFSAFQSTPPRQFGILPSSLRVPSYARRQHTVDQTRDPLDVSTVGFPQEDLPRINRREHTERTTFFLLGVALRLHAALRAGSWQSCHKVVKRQIDHPGLPETRHRRQRILTSSALPAPILGARET